MPPTSRIAQSRGVWVKVDEDVIEGDWMSSLNIDLKRECYDCYFAYQEDNWDYWAY